MTRLRRRGSGPVPDSRGTRALADDRGSYVMELMGFLPAFALVALFAFQLATIGGALVAAENAARSGSRAAVLGRDTQSAVMNALDHGQRENASVCGGDGTSVTVCLDVPIVIPLVDLTVVTVERSAVMMPHAGA